MKHEIECFITSNSKRRNATFLFLVPISLSTPDIFPTNVESEVSETDEIILVILYVYI